MGGGVGGRVGGRREGTGTIDIMGKARDEKFTVLISNSR